MTERPQNVHLMPIVNQFDCSTISSAPVLTPKRVLSLSSEDTVRTYIVTLGHEFNT